MFGGKLASALHVYAVGLVQSGRAHESIPSFDEAVELHQSAARPQREAFAAPLAESLLARAFAMLAVNQLSGALASARQAVDQYRHLAEREPDLFGSALAEASDLVRALEQEIGSDPV